MNTPPNPRIFSCAPVMRMPTIMWTPRSMQSPTRSMLTPPRPNWTVQQPAAPTVTHMDPSIFLQYTTQNGLPQESKLATYMNRSTSTPTRGLSQAMGNLNLDASPTAVRKVMIGDYVPMNYYTPTPILPESPESSPPSGLVAVSANPQVHQEKYGGTTYFYPTNDSLNSTAGLSTSGPIDPFSRTCAECLGGAVVGAASPYASQMYSTPPNMGPSTSRSGLAETFYAPETIRSEIYERNRDVFMQNEVRQYPDVPESVELFSELVPLEPVVSHSIASSYRVSSRATGEYYALRRLHGQTSLASARIDVWKQIDHPNIVRLHDAFVSTAFGDHSIVMVYEYHSQAITLLNKYLINSNNSASAESNGSTYSHVDPFSNDPDAPRPYTHQKNTLLRAVACGALLPEPVVWSVLIQLTAALRTLHGLGLACRALDPTKVIVNGCRIRIAWGGAPDAMHSNVNDIAQAQQDDLTSLGRLALALACRQIHCDNLNASMDLVTRTYSTDLKNFIVYLLSTSPAQRSVTDLMPIVGARFYTQVEALECRADAFEEQLAREIDNGRLLRILIKLGVVNERPELNLDPSWSETGDRYMLKLFRDFIFHSVTEDGRPWIDHAHLIYCLNQLDGGTHAKVELMSRDEESVLVVSYAELKHCLEQAFEEVMQAAASPE